MEFPCGRRGTSALLAILLAALSSACAGGRSASVPEPPPSSLDDILTNGEKLYSQFDEELIIRHFFGDRREGVFLDVGCGPAKRNSTTYYLEHHLGWSGIGIDALPEWGLPYETERPNTRFYNYIVTDHSGDVETFYRVLRGKLRSSVSEGYSQGGNKLPQERIDVTTITLNELLAEAGVSKIDFLSMDIEGSAPPALAGFDIERFRPALVCIESDQEPDYQQTLLDYFEDHGYERIDRYLEHDSVNWYFTPRTGSR